MIHGAIRDEGDQVVLAKVSRTTNAWDRARGLLGREPLQAGEGLLIDPCASVHTFFMRNAIDLVYLDQDLLIQKLVKEIRPWRVSFCQSAAMTLELAAGQIDSLGLNSGMQMKWNKDE